jgi:hypothetical protein
MSESLAVFYSKATKLLNMIGNMKAATEFNNEMAVSSNERTCSPRYITYSGKQSMPTLGL